ncbi:hypothetical protein OIV83_005143 [Microbotryomycetes sp. JL201]|nr:hypothetical protein OIV83_005143 [Microbotryomycetes sp. JL201]
MPSRLQIPELNREHFRHAVEQKHVVLYPTQSVTAVDEHGWRHLLHHVPDFATKPAPPLKTPDLTTTPTRDPFGGSEFGPNDRERVLDLSGSGGNDDTDTDPTTQKHSLVQNLHALCEEHSMIVPTFRTNKFRPQTSDLLEADLAAAWQVVSAYHESGRDVAMFYNGGPLAGASQAHLHMQFCPFQNQSPPGPEAIARRLPPIAVSEPNLLPLPWIMFYASLGDAPSVQTLVTTYHNLINRSKTFISSLDESEKPPPGPKRESYNFLLTNKFAFLMPRTDRVSRVPRRASIGQAEGDEIRLSVNGLLVMGYFYVGLESEVQDLIDYTLSRVLVDAGYRNNDFHDKKST